MTRWMIVVAACLVAGPAFAAVTPADEISETPAHFVPPQTVGDYTRRDVMIPMRDGVKLHTVILIPRGAHDAPMLLTRTPYDATALTSYHQSANLAGALDGYDNADDIIVASGYIRVVQDIRGKYGSEGAYFMNRAPIGPLNHSKTDEATDTYDTIDWLVHHVPESNGRVGTIGISYDGWTTLISLMHPHPALKAAVPMNPMVDGWRGDDWFHNGAFRQDGSLNYVYEQEATRGNTALFPVDAYDDYTEFLRAGSAGAFAQSRGEMAIGFYRKLTEHPDYDAFWQNQAMDKLLAAQPLTVPTLLVSSEWDQEDIYGAMAVWKALAPKDDSHQLYLAMGPWHHGQEIGKASRAGNIPWGSDTALWFRWHVLKPFLDHYLKGEATPPPARVTAFEAGTNRWETLSTWPQGCDQGCTISQRKLYLLPNRGLGFSAPAAGSVASYVSDPVHPIPFIPRPVHLLINSEGPDWKNWLTTDQRPAEARPDVASFETAPLTQPVKLAGHPYADLLAQTTGTDGDFVVKLIDVYPDEVAVHPELGGYELMVSADILRGRFRDSFTAPSAIPANTTERYHFLLPTVNYVFQPGHRIMVQVQSSWFPLYDRNPQSYVPNIFFAKPKDYVPATITLEAGSAVDLPVVSR